MWRRRGGLCRRSWGRSAVVRNATILPPESIHLGFADRRLYFAKNERIIKNNHIQLYLVGSAKHHAFFIKILVTLDFDIERFLQDRFQAIPE